MKHIRARILALALTAALTAAACGSVPDPEGVRTGKEEAAVSSVSADVSAHTEANPDRTASEEERLDPVPAGEPEGESAEVTVSAQEPVSEETPEPVAEAAEETPEPAAEAAEEMSEPAAEAAEETPEPAALAARETPEDPETPEAEETPGITETPAPDGSDIQLVVLTDPREYYYTDLVGDGKTLVSAYSGLVTMDSLGTTADGREIWHFVVGNPDAEKQVFINAATHAREYLTAQLVMKQMAVYLQHVANGDFYGNVGYREMWGQVAVHVVPCVNPDGAALSQLGLDGIQTEEVMQAVREIAVMDGEELTDYYLDTWKANALGTDINRNYDALWEEYAGAGHPSSEMYKGEYPGSSIEAAAMIELTMNQSFLRTVSYHTQGSLIYWNFYNVENFYREAYGFASALSFTTGYPLWDDFESIDALGYSDWCNYRCGIPSVTVECGYGEPPYMQDQFPEIWAENEHVWETTVLSVIELNK